MKLIVSASGASHAFGENGRTLCGIRIPIGRGIHAGPWFPVDEAGPSCLTCVTIERTRRP